MDNGYSHIAIQVDNIYRAAYVIRERGGKITQEVGPMNAGSTIITFVEDPDGYPIEHLDQR
ncbi:MAG: VOC family protein [Sedimenticola sp.]